MKVLLIGFFTRTYMPYMEKYEKILKENNVEYDVVFFDRDSTQKNIQYNKNEYTYCHITTTSRLKKLLPVFSYIHFVKRIINRNKYDKLVVMTTMPCVLLKSLLTGKYKNKYIYDYRDTTYEHFGFFRKIVDDLIDNSFFTAMSSKGYLNVLSNNEKICFNHNISNTEDIVASARNLQVAKSIMIGFLGYVRYFDVNSLLIKTFQNSERYNLLYIGTPFSDCDFASYSKSIGAKNVEVIGKYDNKDKAKLYERIDIINSMYSLNSSEVQYAIPNRLYDAALFKKPLMTTKGTYLSELVERYDLGFSVDPFNDNILKVVEEYVNEFDMVSFNSACVAFLNEVEEDEKCLREKIHSFIDK